VSRALEDELPLRGQLDGEVAASTWMWALLWAGLAIGFFGSSS